MEDQYGNWMIEVQEALRSINMPMEDWQRTWEFNFRAQYDRGTAPTEAAEAANRFWWHEQNKTLKQDCRQTADCWLPRGHQGKCQPVSGANNV